MTESTQPRRNPVESALTTLTNWSPETSRHKDMAGSDLEKLDQDIRQLLFSIRFDIESASLETNREEWQQFKRALLAQMQKFNQDFSYEMAEAVESGVIKQELSSIQELEAIVRRVIKQGDDFLASRG